MRESTRFRIAQIISGVTAVITVAISPWAGTVGPGLFVAGVMLGVCSGFAANQAALSRDIENYSRHTHPSHHTHTVRRSE